MSSSRHGKSASRGDADAATQGGSGAPGHRSTPSQSGPTHRSTLSGGGGVGGAVSPSNSASAGGRSSRRSAAAGAPDLLLLEALNLSRGESLVSAIVVDLQERAFAKLKQHYAQQVAMEDTARHAVELALQAVEWQMLGHDEGEKLQERQQRAAERTEAATTETAPDPLIQPDDRCRPELDAVAAQLALPSPYNQIWTCEDEPEPADLDRWARGVIPTKASAPVLAAASSDMAAVAGATGSFTVHEADESVRSPGSSSTPSRVGLRSPTQPNAGGGGLRKTAVEQAAELLALRATAQPYKLDVVESAEDVAREKQREAELRRLEKKKRIAAEAAAVRAADDAERARLERLQSELRGKNYTLDHKGNAILITPAPVSSFPALQPAPVVRVREVYLTDEQEAEIAKKLKRNRFKGAGLPELTAAVLAASTTNAEEKTQSSPPPRRSHASPSRKATNGKSGRKKSSQELGFDPLSAQPNLVATLTVAKGVTLKTASLSKTFDPRTAPRDAAAAEAGIDHATAELQGLTRAEYVKKLEERRLAASSTLPGGAAASAASPALVQSMSSKSLASSTGSVTGGARPSSSPRAAISAAQAAAAINAHEPSASLSDDAAADDHFSFGGTLATSVAPSSSAPSAAAASSALPSASSATIRARRLTSTEKFNATITNDPLWGLNPPAQTALPVSSPPKPFKPSQADREAAVGRRARNPRERAPAPVTNGTASVERKHLPPAPMGKTTGHGLLDASLIAPLSPSKPDSAPPPVTSPQRPFAKVSKPAVVTATDKAKLYFP